MIAAEWTMSDSAKTAPRLAKSEGRSRRSGHKFLAAEKGCSFEASGRRSDGHCARPTRDRDLIYACVKSESSCEFATLLSIHSSSQCKKSTRAEQHKKEGALPVSHIMKTCKLAINRRLNFFFCEQNQWWMTWGLTWKWKWESVKFVFSRETCKLEWAISFYLRVSISVRQPMRWLGIFHFCYSFACFYYPRLLPSRTFPGALI